MVGYTNVLAALGALWLLHALFNFLRSAYIFVRPSSLKRYHHHHSKSGAPPWAIVTGASDGIGKGYTFELARQGFNLILHGRNAQKLSSVRSALLKTYPAIQVLTITIDASRSGAEFTQQLTGALSTLQGLHITILINNVGTGTRPTGHVFSNYECDFPSDIDALINTNARFPAQFTRAVLPLLLSHGGPALILTTGSITEVGTPYLSVYSATKAFTLAFSRALTREMRAERRPVEVLAIMTAQVTGTATSCGPRSVVQPDAREFARAALRRVGCGYDVVEGWWTHALIGKATRMMPAGMFSRILTEAVGVEKRLEGKSA